MSEHETAIRLLNNAAEALDEQAAICLAAADDLKKQSSNWFDKAAAAKADAAAARRTAKYLEPPPPPEETALTEEWPAAMPSPVPYEEPAMDSCESEVRDEVHIQGRSRRG